MHPNQPLRRLLAPVVLLLVALGLLLFASSSTAAPGSSGPVGTKRIVITAPLGETLAAAVTASTDDPFAAGPFDGCGRQIYRTVDGRRTPIVYTEPCIPAAPEEAGAGLASVDLDLRVPADRFGPIGRVAETGSWPEGLGVGDYDGDGYLDFAIATSFYFDPYKDRTARLYKPVTPGIKYSAVYTRTIDGEADAVATGDFDGYPGLETAVVISQRGTGTSGVEIINPFWDDSEVFAGGSPYTISRIRRADGTSRAAAIDWGHTGVRVFGPNATGTISMTVTELSRAAGWDDSVGIMLEGMPNEALAVSWGQGLGHPAVTIYEILADNTVAVLQEIPREYSDLPNPEAYDSPPTALGAVDVNNDGRLDLVWANGRNKPSGALVVYLQGADGRFTRLGRYTAYDIVESVHAADVTCDGIADQVSTNAGWNAISWWMTRPEGGYEDYVVENHGEYFSHIGPTGDVMADFNNDGYLDNGVLTYLAGDDGGPGLLVMLQRPCVALEIDAPALLSAGQPYTATITLENVGPQLTRSMVLSGTLTGPLGNATYSFGDTTVPAYRSPAFDLMPGETRVITLTGTTTTSGTIDLVVEGCALGTCTVPATAVTQVTRPPITVSFVEPLINLPAGTTVSGTLVTGEGMSVSRNFSVDAYLPAEDDDGLGPQVGSAIVTIVPGAVQGDFLMHLNPSAGTEGTLILTISHMPPGYVEGRWPRATVTRTADGDPVPKTISLFFPYVNR
jgi:hypothetical protein